MQAGILKRRFVLLLPLVLAACSGGEPTVFEPLRYNYLPPIQLKVASIAIEQRFVPAGVAPDVSAQDPVPPVEALKTMANDRLQAFGTGNKAVFAILDAALTQDGDVLIGSMAVSLTILDDNGTQLGFAEARVQSRHTGSGGALRAALYDMTRSMMSDMNVEFEYQIRRNLKPWLTSDVAPDTPVQQTPLDQSSAPDPSALPAQPEPSAQPAPFDQSPSGSQLVPSDRPIPLGQPAPPVQPIQPEAPAPD